VYYFKLAFEYRKVSEFDTTEELYRAGIETEPEESDNWLGLSGLYRQLSRWDDLSRLVEASRVYKFDEKVRANLDKLDEVSREKLGR
jgi:hypothetical protein